MKIIFVATLIFSFTVKANSQCSAQYDEMGIPHQDVKSTEDYYFCFGYHHGKDRAWQMDYFRRFAYGTNAEVLGYKHIKNDFMMRLLDLPSLALHLYQNFPQEYKKLLEHYSSGVNEGFKEGQNAEEFVELGYIPSTWEPVHSVAVLLLQSFDQTKKTFFFDIKEQEKISWHSNAEELFDENKTPWLTTILKDEEYQKKESLPIKTSQTSKEMKMWGSFPELFGTHSGSNNWVVDSKRSESGHAILANDPHLDLKTPLFWYWINLKSKEGNVIGASLPGLPFIASGTNGKVSWGLTNSYLNSADSIIITDLDKKEISSTRPVIWFKLGFLKLPFFFKSMEKFNDKYPVLPLEVSGVGPIVLRWSGYNLDASEITPMFELHKKADVEDVDRLLSSVGVPSWNYVFADTKGQIGYRMVGKTYKNEIDPFGVREMSTTEFLNPAFLEGDERPALLKPKRSYVVTANNQHWPTDSLYKGGRAYSLSFRANRIEEKLNEQVKHNVESTKSIQCDLFVTDAKYFVPIIQKHLPDFLIEWDFSAHDESKELSLYRRFIDILMDEWEVNESALYLLLDNLDKTRADQLKPLYEKATKEVAQRRWGELSILSFEHLSGNKRFQFSPLLSALGDEHTVGPGTTRWKEDEKQYEHFSGASMRMIVEMSDPVKIFINLPGKNREYQKGPLVGPWQDWRKCEYFQIAY